MTTTDISTDGQVTLWVLHLHKGAQSLVAYDGPRRDWPRMYGADEKDLAVALAE